VTFKHFLASKIKRRTPRKAASLLAILIVPVLLGACGAPTQTEPPKIVWWNVFDDPEVYRDMIRDYEQLNRVDIELVTMPFANYEENLVSAIAAGRGPDIFTMHNSWLPEHRDLIAPLSTAQDFIDRPEDEQRDLTSRLSALPTTASFVESYVDVVANDFVSEGRIYAIPLYVDSLALFYNKDLLSSKSIATPPSTWSEFAEVAAQLTVKDPQSRITRAGAAMGTAHNINRSTDILTALMLQNGAGDVDADRRFATFDREISQRDGNQIEPGADALDFYASFNNPTKPNFSWSEDPDVWYSIENFASGTVAMMINYSHQIAAVREKNAQLNFGVSRLPQRDDSTFDISFASYWGQSVSKSSAVQLEAWEFINYLARDDNNLTYLQGNQRPPAKRSLIAGFENDLDLGVFTRQALIAESFYTPDMTLTESVFAQAIDSVNSGAQTAKDALNIAASQVNQKLQTRQFPPKGI
jgi:ABC-type glycerol-3-phosphate transport system substrate-binding protein